MHTLLAAQHEEELSVNTGDKVRIIEDLGDGWLRVQKGGQDGFVPESYVEFERAQL